MRWLIVLATLFANSIPPTAIARPIITIEAVGCSMCAARSNAANFGVSFTPRAKQIAIADKICRRSMLRDIKTLIGAFNGSHVVLLAKIIFGGEN